MSAIEANITVPVDLTNPGQFFACCGLLELADRLSIRRGRHGSASAWFERTMFNIVCPSVPALSDLLSAAKSLRFRTDNPPTPGGESNDSDDEGAAPTTAAPIELTWPDGKPALSLDWWADRTLKPWAGSMNAREILRAMLDSIDPGSPAPFSDIKVALYERPATNDNARQLPKSSQSPGTKPKKKEPFYFDSRRASKSHPLDCGFSPDANGTECDCCPALEALCFVGLQRARPRHLADHRSIYTVWPRITTTNPGLAPPLVGPVVSGAIEIAGCHDYAFTNYHRTDQRKHKAYSQATPERTNNA